MQTSFFHFSLFSCTDGFQGNVSLASNGLVVLPVRVGDAPSHGNVQPTNLRGSAQSGRLLNYGHENIEIGVREMLSGLCERVLEEILALRTASWIPAYLWRRNHSLDLVRESALAAFRVYRCDPVEVCVTRLNCGVFVISFSDRRRIQLRVWTFGFPCPVHVVPNNDRRAGLPFQLDRVSFRLGIRILTRVTLRTGLAKT